MLRIVLMLQSPDQNIPSDATAFAKQNEQYQQYQQLLANLEAAAVRQKSMQEELERLSASLEEASQRHILLQQETQVLTRENELKFQHAQNLVQNVANLTNTLATVQAQLETKKQEKKQFEAEMQGQEEMKAEIERIQDEQDRENQKLQKLKKLQSDLETKLVAEQKQVKEAEEKRLAVVSSLEEKRKALENLRRTFSSVESAATDLENLKKVKDENEKLILQNVSQKKELKKNQDAIDALKLNRDLQVQKCQEQVIALEAKTKENIDNLTVLLERERKRNEELHSAIVSQSEFKSSEEKPHEAHIPAAMPPYEWLKTEEKDLVGDRIRRIRQDKEFMAYLQELAPENPDPTFSQVPSDNLITIYEAWIAAKTRAATD